jgi:O-antigen/teichoic acid export membrane protein
MTKRISLLNAVKWAYTATWGERGFSALFTLILAALLGPQSFGILSIGLIYIAFIQMFLDQGLAAAIVQRKNLERRHLDTVFWTQLVVSFALVVLSISLSRYWAAINHAPQVATIISVLSLCLPIDALALVPRTLLAREMDYRSLAIRSNASVLIGGVIGIVMALAGCGVWSLVGQQVIRELAKLILLWKLNRWRPHLDFSWMHLRDLMGFSLSEFMGQLANFADLQTGSVLLGIFFGPLAVGLYRLAERLANTVVAAGSSSIQWVSLPEFSRFQDDEKQLRESVLTCIRLGSTVTVPALAGLAAVSAPLMLVLGPKWTPAADVMKVLCVAGIFFSFTYFTAPLLQALGKARLAALLEWIRTALGLALLAAAGFAVRYRPVSAQILGVGLARLILGVIFVAPIFVLLLIRHAGLRLKDFLSAIMPSVLCSVFLVVSVALSRVAARFLHASNLAELVFEVLVGSAVGISVLLYLDLHLRAAFFKIARNAVDRGVVVRKNLLNTTWPTFSDQ